MNLSLILVVAGGVFGLVELIGTRGRALSGWGLVCLSVALLV